MATTCAGCASEIPAGTPLRIAFPESGAVAYCVLCQPPAGVPAMLTTVLMPEGLDGPAIPPARTIRPRGRRSCAECGATLKGWRPRSYCDWRCKAAHRARSQRERRAVARAGRICPVCGQPFTPPRSDATTCSPKCRQKAYRDRLALRLSAS